MDAKEIESLVRYLASFSSEEEWFEFKTNGLAPDEIGKYISALANGAMLANERYAYLVFGVHDESHEIVGTNVNLEREKRGGEPLSNWLTNRLKPKLNFSFHRVEINGKSVQVVKIEPGYHCPVQFKNEEYIRHHENLRPLKEFPEKARSLWILTSRFTFEEGICEPSKSFDYIRKNYYFDEFSEFLYHQKQAPEVSLEYFIKEGLLIDTRRGTFDITNLFAIMCARKVGDHKTISGKTVRLIAYTDTKGLKAIEDIQGEQGYAVSFQRLLRYIMNELKLGEYFEHGVRKTKYAHPEIAVREFLANALIHQDLVATGYGPRIEIYPDKMRFTNPGASLVEPEQIINGPARSRNEKLANAMLRGGLCEERGSGVDRACEAIGAIRGAAPLFESNVDSTVVTLYRTNNFNAMTKEDRIRACYQLACLLRVRNEPLTNSDLRTRLGLSKDQAASATGVINDTIEAGLIRPLDVDQAKKNSRYVPHWV